MTAHGRQRAETYMRKLLASGCPDCGADLRWPRHAMRVACSRCDWIDAPPTLAATIERQAAATRIIAEHREGRR